MRFKRFILVLAAVSMIPFASASAQEEHAAESAKSEKIDIKEVIFGHLGDSYEWHITDIGDKHVTIPLPVIVYSKTTGWHIFMSGKVAHGHTHEGFHVASGGPNDGKLVETAADGSQVRPLDLSLTRNAASIILSGALLVWLVLSTARWYRKRPDGVPKGLRGLVELVVDMLVVEVIEPCIGKDYRKYVPYLLTAFFFILINNMMGLIPIFPGGSNVTGNIAVTLVLALFTFFIVNLNGSKEYWKEILWPDVPMMLKFPIPLVPVIELFGIFTKPFALMVRLFANMMAGHAMILGIICLIFVTASLGPAIHTGMSAVSILLVVFMNFVELLVAFIQAYVFTMLSAVFIGLARVEPHHEKTETELNKN